MGVSDRQGIAHQDDLESFGGASQDGGLDVHHRSHGEGGAVVLVEHDSVKALFLGIERLVEVFVIERAAFHRIKVRV